MNAEGSTRAIHETSLIARKLEGLQPYEPTWRAMQRFTAERTEATPDELWLLQHAPVYTLGLAGKPEHVLNPNGIEVVRIDRGGQVTYHGPGQPVAYVLLDLRRRGFGVKELVRRLEGAVIATLGEFAITGERQAGMPGVYVKGAKIAAVGLRVSRGCTYHGLSLNVDMDLQPFAGINPCGYAGLASTSMVAEGAGVTITTVQSRLAAQLEKSLCA